jgi:outer membrane protein assembly factor BamD (BamD/ComL family)
VREEYRDIAAEVEKNKYASAFKVLEDWPEQTWGGKLGQDFALLTGFLDYKAEFYGDAIDELKPLADDAGYTRRRPELLYYLGRAYFANANCAKAVAALERYIDAQRTLGRPILPASAHPSEDQAEGAEAADETGRAQETGETTEEMAGPAKGKLPGQVPDHQADHAM